MPLILTLNPFAAMAVLVSLAAIAWSIVVVRKIQARRMRLIAAMLGMNCVYQGMRLLHHNGYVQLPIAGEVEYLVDLSVSLLYMLGLFVLQLHNVERQCDLMRIRLAEAELATPPPADHASQLLRLSEAVGEANAPPCNSAASLRPAPRAAL